MRNDGIEPAAETAGFATAAPVGWIGTIYGIAKTMP
jgi:hypothetical protein